MNSKKVVTLFFVGTAILFGFGSLVHSSAFMAGRAEGDKIGFERGFREGQESEGETNVRLVKRLEEMFPKREEGMIKDFWEVRFFENKVLFFSPFASPPLMKEFGINHSFHYLYDVSGVYAFPTEEFTLEAVVGLIGPQKEEVFQKL